MWWSAEISIASILLNLIRKFDRNLWCLLIHYIELEVIPNYYFDVTVVLVAADLTWLLMSVIQLETLLGEMSFSIFLCYMCSVEFCILQLRCHLSSSHSVDIDSVVSSVFLLSVLGVAGNTSRWMLMNVSALIRKTFLCNTQYHSQ